jgi:hypothetical protein
MGAGTSTRRIPRGLRLLVATAATAATLAACGADASARPTDARQILAAAIRTTATVPTLKVHAEITSSFGAGLGINNAEVTMALDADVDLVNRQLAGRATTRMPVQLGNGAGPAVQVAEMIVTPAATFTKDSVTGRWIKMTIGANAAGPTNEEIATMLANVLSDPAVGVDLAEAGPCSLGTCDHVVAHVDAATVGPALTALLGMPREAINGQALPAFDIDVLVDQATSVISEVRTRLAVQGMGMTVFVTISNPGQPVQIGPPPPALTDDVGIGGFGGIPIGGGQVTTILETVGNEVEPDPASSSIESPAP